LTQFLNEGCNKPQDSQRDKGHYTSEMYHVRIWIYKNGCVASAHYEIWYLYTHKVHHFEGAEQKIADCAERMGWFVERGKYDLGNFEYERYNNGRATEIRR